MKQFILTTTQIEFVDLYDELRYKSSNYGFTCKTYRTTDKIRRVVSI
jgi:hypothetical protein